MLPYTLPLLRVGLSEKIPLLKVKDIFLLKQVTKSYESKSKDYIWSHAHRVVLLTPITARWRTAPRHCSINRAVSCSRQCILSLTLVLRCFVRYMSKIIVDLISRSKICLVGLWKQDMSWWHSRNHGNAVQVQRALLTEYMSTRD